VHAQPGRTQGGRVRLRVAGGNVVLWYGHARLPDRPRMEAAGPGDWTRPAALPVY
jgi:hypothetical protein